MTGFGIVTAQPDPLADPMEPPHRLPMPSTLNNQAASPRAFFQVLKLNQLVTESLEKALAEQELTPAQYTGLSLIRYHQPITPAELSRKLGITAQSALCTVKTLEARGLIRRAAIPNNRRSIALFLTDEGRSAMGQADRLVLAAEQAFFARLKPKDFERLQDAIRVLRGGAARKPASKPGA